MKEISLLNVIVFSLSVLLCLFCIIGALFWDKKTDDGGSDERQKMMNGRSGNYSFYTMVFVNAVSYLAATRLNLPVDLNVMFLVSIFLGALSYTLYAIWKDAMFTKIWTKKKWIIILILWILLIAYAALGYIKNKIVDNLILSLTACVVLIVVMINLAAKTLVDRKQLKIDEQEE